MARLEADPIYTMPAPMFAQIVDFVRRHYNPVTLRDVLAARAHEKKLPPYPVLVTFDDGWRDNLDHACPILKQARMPWTLFAARDALAEPSCWWQEALLWARRTGRAGDSALWRNAGAEPPPQADELALIAHYAALTPERRGQALANFTTELTGKYRRPQMLSTEALKTLAGEGVAIGVHGAAHLPLDAMEDPAADLQAAAAWLRTILAARESPAMSFPHGRYDARVTDAARAAGFRLLFTSEGIVNPCPGGWLEADLLGRISMAAHDVGGSTGHVSDHRLAPWLFLRERQMRDA
jgi:peptidoglycan/xylan/chitin deacetylase (PgdA/CDA1 family)